MAHSTSAFAQARTTAQTASLPQAEEAAPVLARRSLPDDLTTFETYQGATAPGGANEPQRGTPRRLLLEPGVCHHVQRTPGGAIGWVVQPTKHAPPTPTRHLCNR